MSDNKRAELVQAIRSGWPSHGSTNYQNRGYTEVPPVRDGGMTARLIDYAVDTAIEKLTPRTITTTEELDALPVGSVVLCRKRAWTRFTPKQLLGGLVETHKWMCADGGILRADSQQDIILPATVLHEPTA